MPDMQHAFLTYSSKAAFQGVPCTGAEASTVGLSWKACMREGHVFLMRSSRL